VSRFLLPFAEGHAREAAFSPTAMLLSSVVVGVLISVQTDLLVLVGLMATITGGGVLARTRWRTVWSLAARFEAFVLFWVFAEPFLYGTTTLAVIQSPLGPLPVYLEGLTFGVMLGFRMLLLLLLFMGTLSHMSFTEFVGALRTLRFPVNIVGSVLIMLRYIPQFVDEKRNMHEAEVLRGLERGRRWDRIRSMGYLIGSTMDRAFDRSISVYNSMTLRGFGRGALVKGRGFKRNDALLAVLLIMLAVSLFYVIPAVQGVLSP